MGATATRVNARQLSTQMCTGAWFGAAAAAAEGALAAALLYTRVGGALALVAGVPRDQAAGVWLAANALAHGTLATYMAVQASWGGARSAIALAAAAVQVSVAWKVAYAALHLVRERVSGDGARAPTEAARESPATLAILVTGPSAVAALLAAAAMALPDGRGVGRVALLAVAVCMPIAYVAYLAPLGRLGRNWQSIRPLAATRGRGGGAKMSMGDAAGSLAGGA